jgi:hypothetical protein
MSFTPAEISTIGDINFRARTAIVLFAGEKDRLLKLGYALKDGTYQIWPASDPEPDHVLGLMAATPDVLNDAGHLALLTKFANAIHVGIKPLARQRIDNVPPVEPVPTPPPVVVEDPADPAPPAPPANGDLAAAVRAELERIGVVYNAEGTLEGFKLKTLGAPEGSYYGYMGVVDGALRLFAGIREKIFGKWPQADVNRNLPVVMHAYERDGAISWDWSAPLTADDPNLNPFKSLLIYLGGFKRGVGPRKGVSKHPIDIGTFESSRAVRLFVRR